MHYHLDDMMVWVEHVCLMDNDTWYNYFSGLFDVSLGWLSRFHFMRIETK